MQPREDSSAAEAVEAMRAAAGLDLARAGGVLPANDDVPKPDVFLERAKELIAQHRDVAGKTGRLPKKSRTWAEYQSEMAVRPEPRWLISGMLTEATLGTLVGAPKACKSWLAIDAAVSVATGVPLMGHADMAVCQQVGKTVLLNTENSPKALERRVLALVREKREHSDDPHVFDRRLNENLCIIERQPMNLLEDADLAALLAELMEASPEGLRMLVLDPFRDLFDIEDEKDNTMMGRAIDRCRLIRDALGCAVLVVHHAKKSQGNREVNVREMARGGSSYVGKFDSIIGMANPRGPDKQHLVQDMLVIQRDGQSAENFTLTLAIEDDAEKRARRAVWRVGAFEEKGDANKPSKPAPEEKALTVEGRIMDVLMATRGPASATAVHKEVGGRWSSITETLTRMHALGRVVKTDAGWALPGAIGTNVQIERQD